MGDVGGSGPTAPQATRCDSQAKTRVARDSTGPVGRLVTPPCRCARPKARGSARPTGSAQKVIGDTATDARAGRERR